jgi:hypothetical protein
LDAARIAQPIERQSIQASWLYHLVDKAFATFKLWHLNILRSHIHPNC